MELTKEEIKEAVDAINAETNEYAQEELIEEIIRAAYWKGYYDADSIPATPLDDYDDSYGPRMGM